MPQVGSVSARRIALGAAVLLAAIFGAGVLLSPSITEDKEEQRPVVAETGRAPRAVLVERLEDFVLRDARVRAEAGTLNGPIRRSSCEPHPRTDGRYLCIVATSNAGYRYSGVIDYRTGRIRIVLESLTPGNA
jgi:hypothetical protein